MELSLWGPSKDGFQLEVGELGTLVLNTTSFSNLVNGIPEGFFKSSKGLRQADPVTPYYFVLSMKTFSVMVEKTVQEGLLSGYVLTNRNGEEVQMSLLLFTDDILVFCKESKEQTISLSFLLLWFEVVFGLNINLEKSSYCPWERWRTWTI